MSFVLTLERIKILRSIADGNLERPISNDSHIVIQELYRAGLITKWKSPLPKSVNQYGISDAGTEILRIYNSTQQSVSEALGGFECSESFLALSEALRKAGAPRSGQQPPIRNPAPFDVKPTNEREEFESWYKESQEVNDILEMYDDGDYIDDHTQAQWTAWQGRAEAYYPAELQELRTVARQLSVEHQLQDDARPVQVMIILSNLVKSLSSQVGKLEKLQSVKPPAEDKKESVNPAVQVAEYMVSIRESNVKVTFPFTWYVRLNGEVIGFDKSEYHCDAIRAADEFIRKHQLGA